MKATNNQTALALLCGGRSVRLGTDKGLFRPLGDESNLIRGLLLLAKNFQEILVCVKDSEQRRLYEQEISTHLEAPLRSRIKVVADTEAGILTADSALTGVVTALSACQSRELIAVAVDQLGIRAKHLEELRRLSEGSPAAFAETSDNLLPLPSLWRKTDLERIVITAKAGSLSVSGMLSELGARVLEAKENLRELMVNANTAATMQEYFGSPLMDRFNRRLHYLRFSLTESCNLSCQYCLPDGFPEWYRHKARLQITQVSSILKGFRRLGFRKVRFTGGEPTVHPQCLEAIGEAQRIGYEQICMTTNGVLVSNWHEWRESGLTSINVSLDSLRLDSFKKITKSDKLTNVLDSIDHAIDAGIDVKINTVLLRSMNGGEVEELIDWALGKPLTLRFIELMPTKLNQSFQNSEKVLGSEIEPLLMARGLTNKQSPHEGLGKNTRGPATVYSSPAYIGRIGLINPLSCNFCSSCNRLRVSAKGGVKLCLFGDKDTPLILDSPAGLEAQMRGLIGEKAERHHLEDGELGNVSTFRTIGG